MSEALATPVEETAERVSQAELDSQKAKAIVEPMAREGKTHDEMAIALVQNGFSYKKAGKALVHCLEDMGVLLSRKDRFQLVTEILMENGFDPKTWQDVQDLLTYLASELDATTEKEAFVAVKKFAKQQKIDMPAKPRGQVGRNPNSIRTKQLEWSLENPTASDEEFVAWFESTEEDKGIRYYSRIHEHMRKAFAAGVASV